MTILIQSDIFSDNVLFKVFFFFYYLKQFDKENRLLSRKYT